MICLVPGAGRGEVSAWLFCASDEEPIARPSFPRIRPDLVAPIALLLMLAAMTAFMALDNLVLTRTERGWVSHSRDVIEATQGLFSSAVEVESAQRAYAFNGDPVFLQHFDADSAAVAAGAAKLRTL